MTRIELAVAGGAFVAAVPRCAMQPGLDHAIPKVDAQHINHEREYHVIRHLTAQHQVKALQQRARDVVGRGKVGGEKVAGEELIVPDYVGHTMSPVGLERKFNHTINDNGNHCKF